MKKSVKAALWSGLAFPGAGHFYLRFYLRGFIFLASIVVGCAYIVQNLLDRGVIAKVTGLIEKASSGTIPLDLLTSADPLNLGPDPLGADIASWLIIIFWVGGIVDSYRLGVMQDRAMS